ncbi:MAG: HAD-IIB family hydrolase [Ruminococcaceae bacterium]|nr:HAD-IIB family hydrolase [Oscillospiraceae bacterium]
MKYLIFLDIDETVMSRGEIHPRTVEGISRAKEAGHKVFINTGRTLSIMPQKIISELRPDGYVCGIGSNVIIDGKVEFSRTFDNDLARHVINFCLEKGIKTIIEGENVSVSILGTSYHTGPDLVVSSFDDMMERFPNIAIGKFTVMRPITDSEITELSDKVSVINHPHYSEIALAGCSKSSGMEIVREKLGIDKDHVIAMGDSYNDYDMLRAAGIAVAMGNSLDEIKNIADFVSIPCSEGGVGYAIEKIIFKE